jgi:hypothetical protein
MDTEARTLSHSDIAWGESGEAAYGRKRTAFLRALRSHRLVVERTDGPSDPAPIARTIATHIRAVDALGIDGLDGDDWYLSWDDYRRGRWNDAALLGWAAEAVSHESRVEAYRAEAAALRSLRSAVRSHERVSVRLAAMADANSALRTELADECGRIVDAVDGPTQPSAPATAAPAEPVVSAGRKRPARKTTA